MKDDTILDFEKFFILFCSGGENIFELREPVQGAGALNQLVIWIYNEMIRTQCPISFHLVFKIL